MPLYPRMNLAPDATTIFAPPENGRTNQVRVFSLGATPAGEKGFSRKD